MEINDPELFNIDLEYSANLDILLNSPKVAQNIENQKLIGTRKQYVHTPNMKTNEDNNLRRLSNTCILPKNEEFKQKNIPPDVIYSDNSTLDEMSMDNSENCQPDFKISVKETAKIFQKPIEEYEHNEAPVLRENLRSSLTRNSRLTKSMSTTSRIVGQRIRSLCASFEGNTGNQVENVSPTVRSTRLRNTGILSDLEEKTEFEISAMRMSDEACFSCNQIVYPTDRVLPGNHVYHSRCLRCCICDRILTISSCESSKDKIYCHPHFLELVHGIKRVESERWSKGSERRSTQVLPVKGTRKTYNLGQI